ncbi:uncharacterized protein LOC113315558 [Papaver somniferum]|uniref:uncharacterized protein LOC113315558 n=1 Tax=Papaver somniferum TaxID=3469 RepID=UPI000E6F5CB2|nr:uncharacterized protein LOC113315558 [Papaver somniferum]
MAYFEYYAENSITPAYTYQEFPQHFVGDNKKWKIRQQGFAIARMYFVSPSAGELFYLRLLLVVVAGANSFEKLRTVKGELHYTFKKACIALGLLADDSEWLECLIEAVDIQTGSELRNLFKIILSDCNPTEPEILWAEFGLKICDDLPNRLKTVFDIPNPTDEQTLDYGLFLLDKLLRVGGKKLKDFSTMPRSKENWGKFFGNRLICEHRLLQSAIKEPELRRNIVGLNPEQLSAYTTITESVDKMDGRIASLFLVGGRTAHSTFKIPIEINEASVGTEPEEKIQLPSSVNRCRDMKELICKLYPRLSKLHPHSGTSGQLSEEELTERIILSARNDDVNEINMEVLDILEGETFTYLAADKLNPDESGKIPNFTNEFLQNLNPPGMPLFKLHLKVGCPVILMRNLAPSEGLCNGTRLLVTHCGRHVIQAKILTGHKKGETVLLPRISFQPSVQS